MDNYYVEQIVKRIPGSRELLIKIASIGGSILLIFTGMFVVGSGILVSLGLVCAVITFLLLPRLNVEFEYLYLEKEISVDKIFNMEKRKKAGDFSLDKMEIMAPVNSHSLDQYNGRNPKVYDFTSHSGELSVYVIIINDGGYKKLLIEPNEDMFKAIKDHFPRKVSEF